MAAEIKFKKFWSYFNKPGRASIHTAKWDKCVEDVKSKNSAVNPYAVCTAVLSNESFKNIINQNKLIGKICRAVEIKQKETSYNMSDDEVLNFVQNLIEMGFGDSDLQGDTRTYLSTKNSSSNETKTVDDTTYGTTIAANRKKKTSSDKEEISDSDSYPKAKLTVPAEGSISSTGLSESETGSTDKASDQLEHQSWSRRKGIVHKAATWPDIYRRALQLRDISRTKEFFERTLSQEFGLNKNELKIILDYIRQIPPTKDKGIGVLDLNSKKSQNKLFNEYWKNVRNK
ncbi:MAG: hypothetical protein M1334_00515 [Patescibacteria group bacterium]|nr:hypothetical protein [Patescibacteria group bacterium]